MNLQKAKDSGVNVKEGFLRFRTVTLIIGVLTAFVLAFITDPDMPRLFTVPLGADVFLTLKSLAYFALAVLVVHFGCKGMFDYLDRSKLITRAIEDGQAGHVFIGLGLFLIAFAEVFSALIRR